MGWMFWRRRSRDRELEEEIAFDLDAETEENIRAGLPAGEARRLSRRDFGNILLVKEDTREMWGLATVERLGQDLVYGLRVLRQNPGFTAIAVASLALGIGANTALYSFLDAILLRSLPVPDPQSLVSVQWRAKEQPKVIHAFSGGHGDPHNGFVSGNMPYRAYEMLASSPMLAQTFAFTAAGKKNIQIGGQADLAQTEFVSGTFFGGLRLSPAAGRLIDAGDDRVEAAPAAVLSFAYAQRQFGDPSRAPGQKMLVDEKLFLIAGVAPPEFFGVDPATAKDVYLPLHAFLRFESPFGGNAHEPFEDPNYYWLEVLARLRPEVSRGQAEAALTPLFHNFVVSTASTERERSDLPALFLADGAAGLDSLRRRYSEPLYVLMAMSALILALACVNMANLLLARATARRREMAVRLSLGAGRMRVVRQLLTENLLLAVGGGLVGVVLAHWGIRSLTLLLYDPHDDFSVAATLNWRVLAVTLALSFATGLLFGLAPAWEATRVDLVPALKQVRSGGERVHRWLRINLRQTLVVAQMAISLLLVVAGGLFLHTLANLRAIDLGFNQEHLLVFSINARQAGYSNADAKGFYADLQRRLAEIPTVRSAASSSFALLSGGVIGDNNAYAVNVSPGFFATMQIPILAGRGIDERDVTSGAPVAVVNEVYVKQVFAGQSPLGRTVSGFGVKSAEIIGLAKNTPYASLRHDVPPVVYFCYGQRPRIGAITYELRTAGDPMALAAAVRRVVHAADPRIPIRDLTTQKQLVADGISQERTFAALCACFAALAVIIACIGIYGMMAYNVARRTNEIGIRMALGAARAPVLWMVLREALGLCAIGLAIGVPLAWAGARLVQSFLFQMKARDPVTLALAPAILVAAALVAGYGPALRASRIDPWTALRDE